MYATTIDCAERKKIHRQFIRYHEMFSTYHNGSCCRNRLESIKILTIFVSFSFFNKYERETTFLCDDSPNTRNYEILFCCFCNRNVTLMCRCCSQHSLALVNLHRCLSTQFEVRNISVCVVLSITRSYGIGIRDAVYEGKPDKNSIQSMAHYCHTDE